MALGRVQLQVPRRAVQREVRFDEVEKGSKVLAFIGGKEVKGTAYDVLEDGDLAIDPENKAGEAKFFSEKHYKPIQTPWSPIITIGSSKKS